MISLNLIHSLVEFNCQPLSKPMKIRIAFLFLIFFSFNSVLSAQQSLYIIEKGKKDVDIPFKYENGFIVVNLIINGVLPLKFIFDTGAEYTILAKREFTDVLGVNYEREFNLIGADLTLSLIHI